MARSCGSTGKPLSKPEPGLGVEAEPAPPCRARRKGAEFTLPSPVLEKAPVKGKLGGEAEGKALEEFVFRAKNGGKGNVVASGDEGGAGPCIVADPAEQ
jgi:hypothetical protein